MDDLYVSKEAILPKGDTGIHTALALGDILNPNHARWVGNLEPFGVYIFI